jgi:hypothetical protein
MFAWQGLYLLSHASSHFVFQGGFMLFAWKMA